MDKGGAASDPASRTGDSEGTGCCEALSSYPDTFLATVSKQRAQLAAVLALVSMKSMPVLQNIDMSLSDQMASVMGTYSHKSSGGVLHSCEKQNELHVADILNGTTLRVECIIPCTALKEGLRGILGC